MAGNPERHSGRGLVYRGLIIMPGNPERYANVAQLVEQCLDKAWVVGSSPTVGTKALTWGLTVQVFVEFNRRPVAGTVKRSPAAKGQVQVPSGWPSNLSPWCRGSTSAFQADRTGSDPVGGSNSGGYIRCKSFLCVSRREAACGGQRRPLKAARRCRKPAKTANRING